MNTAARDRWLAGVAFAPALANLGLVCAAMIAQSNHVTRLMLLPWVATTALCFCASYGVLRRSSGLQLSRRAALFTMKLASVNLLLLLLLVLSGRHLLDALW